MSRSASNDEIAFEIVGAWPCCNSLSQTREVTHPGPARDVADQHAVYRHGLGRVFDAAQGRKPPTIRRGFCGRGVTGSNTGCDSASQKSTPSSRCIAPACGIMRDASREISTGPR